MGWASLFALLLAAVAGLAMAVQGTMNSALGKITGLLEATLLVHGSAAVVVAVLLLAGAGEGSMVKLGQAPWYLWLGGLLGVVITYGVVVSIPRIGVAPATTAIIVGQVSMALLLDQIGAFGLEKLPFSWWKLLGLALLAAGARIMLE